MNTDRELLELAAKAAGYIHNKLYFDSHEGIIVWRSPHYEGAEWNPLTDDGKALRLAVKLGMSIVSGTYKVVCEFVPQEEGDNIVVSEPLGGDHYEATRRAIVRAAAEIGKGMK